MLRVASAALLATALFLVVGSSNRGVAAPPIVPTTAHGFSFKIETQLDTNFCIEIAGGATEGRTISLQVCSGVDAQKWAFTWNSDETNFIVEFNGMCLDGSAPPRGAKGRPSRSPGVREAQLGVGSSCRAA